MSILTDVFERGARQIFAKLLQFPPSAAFAMFLRCRETIAIKRRANVTRRSFWKRIPLEERYDFWLAAQKGDHCLNKPRIFPIRTKGREPHLPIQPRLMRRTPARRAHYVTRFPFEFVRPPIDSVGAAFDHNLAPISGHHAKKTVTVYDSERFRPRVNRSEQARPFRFRFEGAVNQPRIKRQSENNDDDRDVDRQSIHEPGAAVYDRRILSLEYRIIN